ncbi:G patch domain and ankyrin repeat-containing protein 1 isoform X2 [Bombina bombina]|uniref:G patch domain and ankyrin repeat-containing protein 1 isoform X2 n=1 Tax=Bombina bombina TaxID=8345 RepID=UPI00235AAB92|nr:G patch domain and ankyrin repeat-containing protein 1 isoform X2 [Bombina bombina]
MNRPQLITFTKAREKSEFWENGEYSKKRSSKLPENETTGQEARKFYESLLETVREQSVCSNPSRKRKAVRSISRTEPSAASSQSSPSTSLPVQEAANQRIGHQLLRCSQEGNLKGLKRLIEKEKCDLNFRDIYYWTAIMCAAYEGRKEVVGYLLKSGAAWVGVCETQGRDALDLAQEAGHEDVVQLLQESLCSRTEQRTERRTSLEKKYCETCRTHYQEDTVETHERSTVHIFSNQKRLPPTYYAIPENNVGFKMMLKEGWDKESGLGPTGTGRKFPIQTVLKRDQKGLGFQTTQKPKVTHFSPNDTLAVERPDTKSKRTQRVATVSRKEERRKEAKQRDWERDLRTYMNIDL